MTLPEELRQAAHYTALDHHRDLLERAAAALEANEKDAARWRFAMKHWKSAKLQWHTKGKNTPKGVQVSFDFTRHNGNGPGLEQFFDEARAALSTQGEKT